MTWEVDGRLANGAAFPTVHHWFASGSAQRALVVPPARAGFMLRRSVPGACWLRVRYRASRLPGSRAGSCQARESRIRWVISPACAGLEYVLVEHREREVESPGALSVARPLVRWEGADDAGEVAAEPDPRGRVRVRPTAFDDESVDGLQQTWSRRRCLPSAAWAFLAQDLRWVDALGEREVLRVGSQRCEPPERALGRLPACAESGSMAITIRVGSLRRYGFSGCLRLGEGRPQGRDAMYSPLDASVTAMASIGPSTRTGAPPAARSAAPSVTPNNCSPLVKTAVPSNTQPL